MTVAAHGVNGHKALPHIDDLTSAPVEVDMNLPLRKLLEKAASLLRQAETDRDFDRPAAAFQEFLQASIITIKVIPRHWEYVSLQGGRADLKRMHTSLVKKIGDEHEGFERIKATIIEDNKRHGTRSEKEAKRAPARALQDLPTTSPRTNGAKTKPAVHPKPQGLHGKAIRPSSGSGMPVSKNFEDLAARFSKLGGPVASPGQDPRIRTHPLVQPNGEAPNQNGPALKTSVPALPKMPDAIYSPARGTISAEAAALPTSTPHGLYTRTGSSTPMTTGNSVTRPEVKRDYFGQVPYVEGKTASKSIPEGETIRADELYEMMKSGTKILLIDVRDRDDFNEGHIHWQAIICVEPFILDRESLTADDLEERLAVEPGPEQELFASRESFDLVVFYDQFSSRVPQYIGNRAENGALLSLKRILTLFSLDKKLKAEPKLLSGGLDEWVDLLGRGSLQSSAATANRPPRRTASKSISRQLPKYVAPQDMSAEQRKAWEEKLAKSNRDGGLVRTTSEFIQKFPAVSPEPQSMTSPASPGKPQTPSPRPIPVSKPPSRPPPARPHHDVPSIPSQPARPAPAASRPSTSGLRTDNTDGSEVPPMSKGAKHSGGKANGQHITGLFNPGNWCYANSTLQCLRMSPGFGRELGSKGWDTIYKIPRKANEKSDHPRLMARIVANLFYWMDEGSFSVMKAQTLMDYSASLTKDSSIQNFGGRDQQDAQEFMAWLMDALDQETNTRRDQSVNDKTPNMANGKSPLQGAHEWWEKHTKESQSIVDRYWRWLDYQTTTCQSCGTVSPIWVPGEIITAPIRRTTSTLEQCLAANMQLETIDGYQCDKCQGKRIAKIQRKMARMPELMCIILQRFEPDAFGSVQKNNRHITWDLNNINMEPYFIPREDRGWDNSSAGAGAELDEHFRAPFDYECYAVIMHSGPSMTSGHYYTYARDLTNSDPNSWYVLNDSNISRAHNPAHSIFAASGNITPYMAFFRRKHRGSSGSMGRRGHL